jgi:quercetin dioxygenase-like cupin family protein
VLSRQSSVTEPASASDGHHRMARVVLADVAKWPRWAFSELQDCRSAMDSWDLDHGDWKPHRPEILCSTEEGRAISLDLPAGEMLQDHQVHEGAWITVIRGELRIASGGGQAIEARPGTLVHLAQHERHEVKAVSDARILLLLTPWPGPGHPGAMTLQQKADVRTRAAERAR